jgi:hypothetical protein
MTKMMYHTLWQTQKEFGVGAKHVSGGTSNINFKTFFV